MIEFLSKGGILMIPIFICSIIAVGIILERAYCFWKESKGLQKFIDYLQNLENKKEILKTGSQKVRLLEKNLRGLAVIANVTPLLGLLGTVFGMIKAFIVIQNLGGGVDASVLAGGIWEALLTTAAGLSVAIPTSLFYHYFEGKADGIAILIKETVREKIEH
ncbi:MAG: MotA/TolQ/ExbB proton channel family protein [Candidatus Hydrogenedentota bacterium]